MSLCSGEERLPGYHMRLTVVCPLCYENVDVFGSRWLVRSFFSYLQLCLLSLQKVTVCCFSFRAFISLFSFWIDFSWEVWCLCLVCFKWFYSVLLLFSAWKTYEYMTLVNDLFFVLLRHSLFSFSSNLFSHLLRPFISFCLPLSLSLSLSLSLCLAWSRKNTTHLPFCPLWQ